MSLARLVIASVVLEGRTKSEVARDYRVSRRWVQTLVARYRAEGEAGLEPRSRRPHASPSRTAIGVEDEIVELRKTLAEEGLDAGAATIAVHLARRHGAAPAVSTIWRVLSRRGFVTPEPHKRPRSSFVRFAADQPNERWQADVTHWALADGRDVEILNVLDDHSRLLVAADARRVFKAADVVTTFRAATAAHGLPASLLTDNAAIFTGRLPWPGPGGAGDRAGRALDRLPARPAVSPADLRQGGALSPDAEEVAGPPAGGRRGGQPAGAAELVHRLLQRRPPAPGAGPAHAGGGLRRPAQGRPARGLPDHRRPLPGAARRHRRQRVTVRHNSRLHHLGIGRRHAGVRVLVLVHDLDIRVLTTEGVLLRELTLDPSRDYQRQR